MSLIRKRQEKIKKDVILKPPDYINRHEGRDFLVMAAGPSLRNYRKKIQKFIDIMKPVVMAGNYIDHMFVPDYHAFINRGRFCSYVQFVEPSSKILLSPYFTDNVIKEHYNGEYEEIAYKNIYPGTHGKIAILDGIIDAEGATIGTILIGVAIVMGAKNIYAVGMDGYSSSKITHHYHEIDNKEREELIKQEASMRQQLESIKEVLEERGCGEFHILTPTVYHAHYKPIEQITD